MELRDLSPSLPGSGRPGANLPDGRGSATEPPGGRPVLEEFFSRAPSPLAVWNVDGSIVRANPAWERILGFTSAEMEWHPILDFVHPEDRAAALDMFRNILDTGEEAGFECRCLCKDGSYKSFVFSAIFFREAGLIYSTAQDITDRKRVEDALRDSEERFRTAFDNALIGMASITLDGRFQRVNESLCRITGCTREELLGSDYLAPTHPDDRAQSASLRLAMLAGETPGGVIMERYVRKDGQTVWVRTTVALARDAAGEPLTFITLIEDISERKRSVDALRRSEEWLRSAQAAAGVGIWEWDSESGRTRASEQQFRLYGLEPGEEFPTGDAFLERIHPEDRQRLADELELTAAGKALFQSRFRVIRQGDGVRWLAAQGQMFFDRAGKPTRFIGATVDMTDRIRAETAFEKFFNLCSSPLAITDFDGRFQRINPAVTAISGFTFEEMQQGTFLDRIHPDDRAPVAERLGALVGTGTSWGGEVRILAKDGSYVWLVLTLAAVKDENLIYSSAFDITKRKRAEEALRKSEKRFKLIAETIDEVFWIAELETHRTIYVSPAFEHVWGRTQQEVCQDPECFLESIYPDDRETLISAMKTVKNGLPFDTEYRIRRPDGSIAWIWGHGYPVPEEAGSPILYTGVAQDITVRKRMEDELKQHAEKLARSNSELERFAYVASHDLQEPLRMVASFTQLLGKRYSGKLDETADRYIHYAVDGAQRMQVLISDLLAYSRVNSKELDLRATDCETVVRAAMRNLEAAIQESGASVQWDPLPTLVADPAQLGHLFQNIFGNAIKFRRKQEAPRINISATDKGTEWLFSVRDNGIGIEPHQVERIFQIFQRLHGRAEYAGTGIGLAICKKVVERHGGRIWVESEPGAGSDFRFTLAKRKLDGGGDARTQ
jgi:PAS domain S-box-containing protein